MAQATDVQSGLATLGANGWIINGGPYWTPNGGLTPFLLGRLALARTRAGSANTVIMCIGDSLTAGLAGDGTFGGRTTSYPAILRSLLQTLSGFTARINSSLFDATGTFNNTNWTTYDSRWVLGANWSLSQYSPTGHRHLLFNNATPTNATFTPVDSCDRYDIHYVSNPVYGTLTIGSAGASPSTINMSAATLTRKVTVSVTAGQPLILTPPVSTQVNISAVVGYTAATPEVTVINAGQGGSLSNFWADRGTVFTNSFLIDSIAPNIGIVCLGVNDWLAGVNVATYKAQMNAIVSRLRAISCDPIVVSPFPSGITNVALASQRAYADALLAVASENSAPFIDLFQLVGSYEIANPLGYYQASQSVHPSVAGYSVMGHVISQALRSYTY